MKVSAPTRKIVIVGLGTAGLVHARALEDIPGVAVVAGIDTSQSRPLTFRGAAVPTYPSVFDTTSDRLDPDIVVVATPTPTHAQVCSDVGEYFAQATIVVEKPAAGNLADARQIIDGIGGKQPVKVAYHMAFAPEVDWGLQQTAGGQLGSPVAIESRHADPYQADLASARARLETSWIDTGINALSVIERFAKPVGRTSLRQIGPADQSVYEGTFSCEAAGRQLTATIRTSWHSPGQARSTRIRYSSGAELIMDHHRMTACIKRDGAVTARFCSDGSRSRREAHYWALYRSWLIDHQQVFSIEASRRLHKLLLDH